MKMRQSGGRQSDHRNEVALDMHYTVPDLAQEMPKPGPEHEILKKKEGTWLTTMKAGDMESKGTVTFKMELSGL
jgi:hypothetical protein